MSAELQVQFEGNLPDEAIELLAELLLLADEQPPPLETERGELMARYERDHRGYLIGPNKRAEYAQAVTGWLHRALPYYEQHNVRKHGCQYRVTDDSPPQFCYVCGATVITFQPPRPSDLLFLLQGNYPAARKQILQTALELLREAHPRDRQELRKQFKNELH